MNSLIQHFAAFDAVAKAGSMTRAAAAMSVSQPAISSQMRALQRALKSRLFERKGRGIRLTQQGETLARYTGQITTLLDQAAAAMADAQHLRIGRLSVAASPTIGTYLLPEALVRFRQRFPAIVLHLEIGNARLLRERLQIGAIEIALTETALPAREFDSDVFASDELVAIVPATHPLARHKQVQAARLAKEPFVAREPASGTRSLVERALADRGLSVRPVIALSSTEAVKRAVAAGLGISIVSKMSVGQDVAAGALVALRVSDLQMRRPILLVRARGHQPSKPEIAFLCLLRHVIRGTLPKIDPQRTTAAT